MTENILLKKDCQKLHGYLKSGGYLALSTAIKNPEQVIPLLNVSGLKGRSGSGFPVGLKWKTTLEADKSCKFIVCNADEGEPATNKDRMLLLENPYSVIEGMTIAAVAVGAQKGFIYLRAEYPYLVTILEKALKEAMSEGYLGKNIMGSEKNFFIELRIGAGAYICGEETALLESLEGKRGITRLKPPYPGVCGYMGMPTVINNVETFAAVAAVLSMGPEKFCKYGTKSTPGTKLVTLSGCIRYPGVYEISPGLTIRQIFEMAGGCADHEEVYAVQTGGMSGPILPVEKFDNIFDIEQCKKYGGFFGTGSLMFIPISQPFVSLIKNITAFFSDESCGKCVPCRIGTATLVTILDKISLGQASDKDLEILESVARHIQITARCGLGKAAVTPLLSSLEYFRDQYTGCIMKRGENQTWNM